MQARLLKIIVLFTLLAPGASFAQKLNIDGYKIKLAADAIPNVVFPDEINNYTLNCGKDNYSIRITKNTVTIRAAVEKPDPCTLIIYEGPNSRKLRMHRFILVFVGNNQLSQEQLYHNFSTVKLLRNQISIMESEKRGTEEAPLKTVKAEEYTAPDKGPEKGGTQVRADNNVSSDPNVIRTGGVTISRPDFEKRAIQKTEALSTYLKILCEKHPEKYDMAIDGAVALFSDEDRYVEVVSNKPNAGAEQKKPYKIRAYLTRMTRLHYDKVELSWTKMQYVSNLQEQADGSYSGYVMFEQTFNGIIDGKLVYGDITNKRVEVKLKLYKKVVEGKEKLSWDVLLGNIGVSPVG